MEKKNFDGIKIEKSHFAKIWTSEWSENRKEHCEWDCKSGQMKFTRPPSGFQEVTTGISPWAIFTVSSPINPNQISLAKARKIWQGQRWRRSTKNPENWLNWLTERKKRKDCWRESSWILRRLQKFLSYWNEFLIYEENFCVGHSHSLLYFSFFCLR